LKIRDLPAGSVIRHLQEGTLRLRFGPFVANIRSDIARLGEEIAVIYGESELESQQSFADFHVEVLREPGVRRWMRPQARFYFDGQPSFIPLLTQQAFAMLEWGLNWCVASHAHQYLAIHAAIVEKDGRAALLPAPPGSGKSTLCAALVQRGWRLLSDELALYDMDSGLVHGMARPINLKNASIDIIRNFAPEAVLTRPVDGTTKGTIALLKPPAESVRRVAEPVRPTWIVLPAYAAGAAPAMEPQSRARTFMLLAEQSFNYDVHGQRGFEAVGRLVDACGCHRFRYSALDDAVAAFDALLRESRA
jgi:HprK-related kinase A